MFIARVSTSDQTLDLQKDDLQKAGCERIFTDTASGAKSERKGLDEALSYVRAGDTLVVWRLDRLGRSLKHLIETITALDNRKIGFKSITEAIDTTTSGGKLIFHIFGALAEFERDIIKERTQAGLTAARARGRKGGRPKKLNPPKADIAKELYDNRKSTVEEICRTLNISRAEFLCGSASYQDYNYNGVLRGYNGPRRVFRPSRQFSSSTPDPLANGHFCVGRFASLSCVWRSRDAQVSFAHLFLCDTGCLTQANPPDLTLTRPASYPINLYSVQRLEDHRSGGLRIH